MLKNVDVELIVNIRPKIRKEKGPNHSKNTNVGEVEGKKKIWTTKPDRGGGLLMIFGQTRRSKSGSEAW